jgi:ADP-ribosylglycohydrolase
VKYESARCAARCDYQDRVANETRRDERTVGCFLGGAVGDALGAPVEFLSLGQIRQQFGADGIGDFSIAYGRIGAITDDTQMTLFTAEGIIRTYQRARDRGQASYLGVLKYAYLRWLATQERVSNDRFLSGRPDGWLWEQRALHSRRAPGTTCLSASRSDRLGSIEEPINDSKGCGGVMRIAPVGLAVELDAADVDAFEAGSRIAALTHGHPSGYLSAGVLAAVVRWIVGGRSLDSALVNAIGRLREWRGYEETLAAVLGARDLASSGHEPRAELVETLGQGWVAEEALAIGLYCALVAEDFEHGVRLAVNHGGDSDSTGAIAGNVLGAQYGSSAIPLRWLATLELREEIEQLAHDLISFRFDADNRVGASVDELRRYPPN